METSPGKNGERVEVLRNYQQSLVKVCCETNSIIFLPTGSGKTFVAIQTLLSLGDRLEKSNGGEGKLVFFLAPTKALVYQHAKSLEHSTPFRVSMYTGDMQVDFWSRSRWNQEMEKNQVLVMTPNIMTQILTRCFLSLSKCAIVIFDECHNGVDDHPYREVMREMKNTEEKSRPRIIGLTATLLNRTVDSACKVDEQLLLLESTYHAQIATCDDLADVIKYSANPISSHVTYIPSTEAIHPRVEYLMNQCLEDMRRIAVLELENSKSATPHGFQSERKDTLERALKRSFDDIKENYRDLGIYGGSIATLFHYLEYEQKRLMSDDELKAKIYEDITGVMNTMQSVLTRLMNDDQREGPESVLKFTSHKVNILLDHLKNQKNITCIIFVQRRSTAIVLFHILKKISSSSEEFAGLKPGYLVGGRANPLSRTKQATLESKWQRQTLQKFEAGEMNVLVATSVVEEGVDVPVCNRVYRFDLSNLHYRSYIQAKGRARSKDGHFIVFVPENKLSQFLNKKKVFHEIEDKLYKSLMGRYELRSAPTLKRIETDLYDEEVEPFFVAGPSSSHVTGVTSIHCVQKYCSSLPQDLFSNLVPFTFYKKSHDGRIIGAVQLPIASPVRVLIQGLPMKNKKLAKRAGYVRTVELLYKEGELTDDLVPRKFSSEVEDFRWLFPHYKTESVLEGVIPGTKRFKRIYDNKVADVLTGCVPEPDVLSYLHVLSFTPAYQRPTNNRHSVFHSMLSEPHTYAILSTKQCPKICDFPVYMSVGEIKCELLNNASSVVLNAEQLKRIKSFHMQLFTCEMANVVKECFALSNRNAANSYLVVPVQKRSAASPYEIDWNIVDNVEQLSADDSEGRLNVNHESYHMTVVSPKYRQEVDPMYYMVTDVCTELSPDSPFPDINVSATYSSYFKMKYGEEIENLRQPLLEVKKLPSVNGNFIRPRGNTTLGIRSQRKLLAAEEDFDEKLVPELCLHYRYPGALWLKCVLLPTALFRVHSLLNMYELHIRLCVSVGTRQTSLPLEPLVPNPSSSPSPDSIQRPKRPRAVAPKGVVTTSDSSYSYDEAEPVDFYANMDTVAKIDLQHYVNYALTPALVSTSKTRESENFLNLPKVKIVELNILEPGNFNEVHGLQLRDLLAACTAKSANDIVNLERLETLGDSLLKFTASFFLFKRFPKLNEGQLTSLKGQLVSNKNLLYCAQKKGLPSILHVQEFSVKSDWVAPLWEIPHEVADILRKQKKDPTELLSVCIPFEEKLSGFINPSTRHAMLKAIESSDVLDPGTLQSRPCAFLQQKVISDKGVADSTEALIGAYLLAGGVEESLKVLSWLDIIPKEDAMNLFHTSVCDPALPGISQDNILCHLNKINYRQLEDTINYKFKNKAFLLQAMTHATSMFHRATDCYQRLEFLGDAVLDFLVTCYIWQEGGNLDPGEITSLRSALVNNVTFGCLSVRYGLHRFMLRSCSGLDNAICSFAELQNDRNHVVDEAVLDYMLDEKAVNIAEAVEVPKALGDLFESLAGAIYLDSGYSLQAVWQVFYPLMKKEFDEFMAEIPRNSVQILQELTSKVEIKTELLNGTLVRVRINAVLPDGQMFSAYGFGPNKFEAKRSAAKVLLRKTQP